LPLALRILNNGATLVDFSLVEREIQQRTVEGHDRGAAFARYVVESYFGLAATEVEEHIVDGGNDRGIDIIYIDTDRGVVNICSCKCVATFSKSQNNFPGAEIDKLITFMDDFLQKNEKIFEGANGSLCAKIRHLWSKFEDGEVLKVQVHLFSNQLCLADGERLNDRVRRYDAELFEHGLYQLTHGVIRAAKPKFDKKLSPEKDSSFKVEDGEPRGWQIRVSLENIFKFVTDLSKGAFDERLIEENVRYFLGIDNPANAEIKKTLVLSDLRHSGLS
jgi:hypothetical protein